MPKFWTSPITFQHAQYQSNHVGTQLSHGPKVCEYNPQVLAGLLATCVYHCNYHCIYLHFMSYRQFMSSHRLVFFDSWACSNMMVKKRVSLCVSFRFLAQTNHCLSHWFVRFELADFGVPPWLETPPGRPNGLWWRPIQVCWLGMRPLLDMSPTVSWRISEIDITDMKKWIWMVFWWIVGFWYRFQTCLIVNSTCGLTFKHLHWRQKCRNDGMDWDGGYVLVWC